MLCMGPLDAERVKAAGQCGNTVRVPSFTLDSPEGALDVLLHSGGLQPLSQEAAAVSNTSSFLCEETKLQLKNP